MNTSKVEINDLEQCLTALGAENPFNADGELTNEGYNAYNKLRQMLHLMEQFGVVNRFSEDMLDIILNENS